jgi:hypothetical protein
VGSREERERKTNGDGKIEAKDFEASFFRQFFFLSLSPYRCPKIDTHMYYPSPRYSSPSIS